MVQLTFYRHLTRPDVFAVSPDSTGTVLPNPEDWEIFRQQDVNTTMVLPGTELATWIEEFRKKGYCELRPNPDAGPHFTESESITPPPDITAPVRRWHARLAAHAEVTAQNSAWRGLSCAFAAAARTRALKPE
jgi:hypothetical protein